MIVERCRCGGCAELHVVECHRKQVQDEWHPSVQLSLVCQQKAKDMSNSKVDTTPVRYSTDPGLILGVGGISLGRRIVHALRRLAGLLPVPYGLPDCGKKSQYMRMVRKYS